MYPINTVNFLVEIFFDSFLLSPSKCAHSQDLDESGRNQTNGIEELQALLQERENNGPGDESKKDSEQDSHSLSSLASVKEDDLENKRNELVCSCLALLMARCLKTKIGYICIFSLSLHWTTCLING